MAKMTIEGDEKKINKLRKELKLKLERNGLTLKEDKPVAKEVKSKKVEKKESVKKEVKK